VDKGLSYKLSTYRIAIKLHSSPLYLARTNHLSNIYRNNTESLAAADSTNATRLRFSVLHLDSK
jgi:hypothetical protein